MKFTIEKKKGKKEQQQEFVESLIGMEEQPLIVPPKNPKVIPRRDIKPEKIC